MYRQHVVCRCLYEKIIDSTGLFECELSGKWFLGKVDDGFQSLATYSIQQVYCLLKSEYKVGYDAILLRESRLIRALIIFDFFDSLLKSAIDLSIVEKYTFSYG